MNENSPEQKAARQKYSPQFKDQVVERVEKEGVVRTARDLGLPESMVYSWRTKKRQGGQPLEHQKLQQAEMARLKRAVERLEEENAFLKKTAAYFAKESK